MNWIIYYADGSTYMHPYGQPWYAPGKNVIGILYNTEEGWLWMSGYHYYVWDADDQRWRGIQTQDTLWFYLAEGGMRKVLFTVEVTDQKHEKIVADAIAMRRELNDA